jgi:hypothetical protein
MLIQIPACFTAAPHAPIRLCTCRVEHDGDVKLPLAPGAVWSPARSWQKAIFLQHAVFIPVAWTFFFRIVAGRGDVHGDLAAKRVTIRSDVAHYDEGVAGSQHFGNILEAVIDGRGNVTASFGSAPGWPVRDKNVIGTAESARGMPCDAGHAFLKLCIFAISMFEFVKDV